MSDPTRNHDPDPRPTHSIDEKCATCGAALRCRSCRWMPADGGGWCRLPDATPYAVGSNTPSCGAFKWASPRENSATPREDCVECARLRTRLTWEQDRRRFIAHAFKVADSGEFQADVTERARVLLAAEARENSATPRERRLTVKRLGSEESDTYDAEVWEGDGETWGVLVASVRVYDDAVKIAELLSGARDPYPTTQGADPAFATRAAPGAPKGGVLIDNPNRPEPRENSATPDPDQRKGVGCEDCGAGYSSRFAGQTAWLCDTCRLARARSEGRREGIEEASRVVASMRSDPWSFEVKGALSAAETRIWRSLSSRGETKGDKP